MKIWLIILLLVGLLGCSQQVTPKEYVVVKVKQYSDFSDKYYGEANDEYLGGPKASFGPEINWLDRHGKFQVGDTVYLTYTKENLDKLENNNVY